jgi:NNP family nitrate/nitrite transporter-like MFS transporter
MNIRDFLRAGHWPTLLAAFVYFDISFLVWVLLGGLSNHIAADLELTHTQRGLLVATPLLGGALLRIVLGLLTDRVGARRTALIGLTSTLLPLIMGWLGAHSFAKLLWVGLLLGIAGASFAAALPLAGRWYPPQYQGLALGIAGAGNSGTALATFFAPRLAELVGWQNVFGLAVIPVLTALLVVVLLAREAPNASSSQPVIRYFRVLREQDSWWLCGFYAVTFGGFVGLASFLNTFYRTQYGVHPVVAGSLATISVLAGSFLRPVGGYLADRFGGVRVLTVIYGLVAAIMTALACHPSVTVATVLFTGTLGLLGMGNGAVFQLVPQRFPRELGVITGLIGAAGGLGGFFLPTSLGLLRDYTGSYAGGLAAFAAISLVSAVAIVHITRAWYGIYIQAGGLASASLEPSAPGSAILATGEEA